MQISSIFFDEETILGHSDSHTDCGFCVLSNQSFVFSVLFWNYPLLFLQTPWLLNPGVFPACMIVRPSLVVSACIQIVCVSPLLCQFVSSVRFKNLMSSVPVSFCQREIGKSSFLVLITGFLEFTSCLQILQGFSVLLLWSVPLQNYTSQEVIIWTV